MPTYTVRAPNGRTYKVQGPAGATQKQIEEAVLKAHPEAAGTGRVPKEGALGKVETFGMGLTRGIDEALFGTGRLIGQGLEMVGANKLGGTLRRASERELAKSQAQYEPFVRANPRTAETGRIGGQIIGLAAPGKVATLPLKAAARVAPVVAPVTTALSSGGLATGVKATTPVAKAIDAALRIGGGAAAGAASSAVLNQAIDEGAAVGAAVSMIPLVGRYGVGPVWDALKGRVGEARAAKIFRQALGSNVDAARAAFRKGGKGTASQILARVGIDADTFFSTGQLVAKSGASTGVLDDIARGQEAAREATLTAAAGGGTRTASRRAADVQRAGTRARATPIMEEALGGANVNTRNAMIAGQEARLGRAVAQEETRAAKRLLGAADEQALKLGQMDDLGDPLDIAAINRQRGVVGGLEQAGAQAAERGLEAGAMARTAEQRLADLTAAGVQPLNAGNLSGRLRQMAAAERANPEKAAVLAGFADQLEDLAGRNGGIIDAFDLYELRKDAGGIVERLLQGRTPDAIRKRTAEVVGAVRPLIDNAIESAGGKRWREYLDTFATGMDEARRVELADFARKMAADQPEQFQRLMRGDRPDIVERFFGKGRYDINDVLGPKPLELQGPTPRLGETLTATPAGPSRLPALQNVAEDLKIETFIKNRMTPGSNARAATLMEPPVNLIAEASRSLPFQLGYPISAASDLLENKVVAPRVVGALERGFASSQGASALLDYTSTGQKGFNLLEGLSPDTLRMLQQFGVQTGREPQTNSMRR